MNTATVFAKPRNLHPATMVGEATVFPFRFGREKKTSLAADTKAFHFFSWNGFCNISSAVFKRCERN